MTRGGLLNYLVLHKTCLQKEQEQNKLKRSLWMLLYLLFKLVVSLLDPITIHSFASLCFALRYHI